jgi:putative ABC transport system permease protein
VFTLALSTFRDRWPVFLGAIASLAVGVALVESSLLVVASAQEVPVPAGASRVAAAQVRAAYDDVATVMIISSMISLFLTVFIVSTTFAFTVARRRRELALLRLAGGSRSQITRLLLAEALILAACGGVAGAALGAPAVRVQVWVLSRVRFLPDGFTTGWSAWPALVAVAGGGVVAVLGVLAAARRAARIRPLEVLRDGAAATRVMTVPRWIVGLAMAGLSLLLMLLAPAAGLVVAVALALGLSVVGGVALSLLSPLVVPLTGRLFGLVLRRGVIGGLAEANLRHGVRRSASTAAPLIVLVSLLLGLAGTLGSVAKATAVDRERATAADLVVESTGAAAERVAAIPGVAVASTEVAVPALLEMAVAVDGNPDTETDDGGVLAIDPAAYGQVHPTAGDLSALTGPAIAATQNTADGKTFTPGQPVTVDLGDGPRTLRLVAIMPERLSTGGQYLVPRDLVPADLLADAPAHVVVRVAAGAEPDTVATAIRAAGIGDVTTVAAWAAAQTAEQQRTNNATLAVLMGLAGLYAVIAVVNAVVMAGADRGREFAVLRLTGFARGQVVRAALVESAAVTMIGLLLGGFVVAGTFTGIAAAGVRTVGTAVVAVPWGLAAATVAGAFLVTGVTAGLTALAVTRSRPVRLAAARQ